MDHHKVCNVSISEHPGSINAEETRTNAFL